MPDVAAAARRHTALILDLGPPAQRVLGASSRWRRDDEYGILFNMKNDETEDETGREMPLDASCSTQVTPIPDAQHTAYHMVRFAPYVATRVPSPGQPAEMFVHHMDVYVCDKRIGAKPIADSECLNDVWLRTNGPCYALLWAYDKGALAPHELPADAGFKVGAGTPFTHLLLQIHYLLPYGGVSAAALRAEGYADRSGVVATLLPRAAPAASAAAMTAAGAAGASVLREDAWSFEFMDMNMAIPQQAAGFEYAPAALPCIAPPPLDVCSPLFIWRALLCGGACLI